MIHLYDPNEKANFVDFPKNVVYLCGQKYVNGVHEGNDKAYPTSCDCGECKSDIDRKLDIFNVHSR